MSVTTGNIVLLNGTSSAGKSTLAKALQAIMETPSLPIGIDHFLPRLPSRLLTVAEEGGGATSDEFLMVYRGDATQATAQVEGGEVIYGLGTLVEVRLGPKAVALMGGMYRSIAALADSGIDVIVDDVIHDRRVLREAVRSLPPERVLFVGLHLPREVAEQRERERGERGPGGALAFYDRVHAHGLYDLELDTSTASPAACAAQIKDALINGHPLTAFARLAQIFATDEP